MIVVRCQTSRFTLSADARDLHLSFKPTFEFRGGNAMLASPAILLTVMP